jgi:multiple antibiotic resistance protein
VGAVILNFFGISLPVVQLAGGSVLAAMGWELLNQKDEPAKAAEVPVRASIDLDSRAFYPLTFPVTAGPGCIVVVLTLSAHASQHAILKDVAAHAGIFAGTVFVCGLVYLSYAYAPALTRRISPQTLHGVLRIIAFVLLCIGVQIAWKGVQGLVPSLAAH